MASNAALKIVEPDTQQGQSNSAFQDWLSHGRVLVEQRRNVDWLIGDWLADGKERFPEQFAFDLLAENLGIAPKRLRDITQAAAAFPPHVRDASLSIEHHATLAALPTQEALPLLKEARERHWTPEQVRERLAKLAEPRANNHPDDDSFLASLCHTWNRAPRRVRLDFAEMVEEANGEEIEP